MTTIPTFTQDGKLLIGTDATKAWASQAVRCGCGDYGDKSEAVSGSCHDMPAEWLGCTNCSGHALGRPLIYRTQSQIAARRRELVAK